MADWTKELNNTPHRVEVEKVEREPRVKKWNISLLKIDFENEITSKAAKCKIESANDKNYIIVSPRIEIEKMRREVQKFDAKPLLIQETTDIIMYMHIGTESDETPYSYIYKRVSRTAFYHAYLITIPAGIDAFNFAGWVNNLVCSLVNAKSKK